MHRTIIIWNPLL